MAAVQRKGGRQRGGLRFFGGYPRMEKETAQKRAEKGKKERTQENDCTYCTEIIQHI